VSYIRSWKIKAFIYLVANSHDARFSYWCPKGSDTSESFLSKVAFESNLLKKLASKNRTCSNHRESFFRKKINCERLHDTHARFLYKVTFESDFQKKTF